MFAETALHNKELKTYKAETNSKDMTSTKRLRSFPTAKKITLEKGDYSRTTLIDTNLTDK
jgi:hypothetical protein